MVKHSVVDEAVRLKARIPFVEKVIAIDTCFGEEMGMFLVPNRNVKTCFHDRIEK